MFRLALFLFAILIAAPAFAQQGERASLSEVSKSVRGEVDVPIGPGGIPQPPAAEDGRPYYYTEIVRLTAIRDFRPVRTYAVWPRLTLPLEGSVSETARKNAAITEAILLALSEVTQVDWPGEAKIDLEVATAYARQRLASVMEDGELDALDFIHIEVQVF